MWNQPFLEDTQPKTITETYPVLMRYLALTFFSNFLGDFEFLRFEIFEIFERFKIWKSPCADTTQSHVSISIIHFYWVSLSLQSFGLQVSRGGRGIGGGGGRGRERRRWHGW